GVIGHIDPLKVAFSIFKECSSNLSLGRLPIEAIYPKSAVPIYSTGYNDNAVIISFASPWVNPAHPIETT
ncbi:MAG: hypothetical protein ACO2ZD_12170, partial [Pseudomonadales bacterium]